MSNCMPINQITEEMKKNSRNSRKLDLHTLTKEPMLRTERAQES